MLIDINPVLDEFRLFGVVGALIQNLLQVLNILLIGLPEHWNPMLIHKLIIQNRTLPQLLSHPHLFLLCLLHRNHLWLFGLVLYTDSPIGVEPILQILLHFFKRKRDPIQVKLALLAIRSGPVVLLNDLLGVGLTLIFFEVVLPLSDELDLLKLEDIPKEGV